MEKKNVERITDDELRVIIERVRNRDSEAIKELIDIYEPDIRELSKYLRLSEEESFQSIVVEFLEYISREKLEELNEQKRNDKNG